MADSLLPREIVIGGRKLTYVDAGSGPSTVLLIHGFAATWTFWTHTIPALATTHRVIAFDLPGFGGSENPAAHGIAEQLPVIPELLDALGVERCSVVGHSMGTLVAAELAAQHPERVDRVVLAGGPITSVMSLFKRPIRTLIRNPRVATFLVEALTSGAPPTEDSRRAILTKRWARWLALRAFVPHPWALTQQNVNILMDGAGAPAAKTTLRQGFTYDPAPALARIAAPTLVVNGARDTICPPSDAHLFAESNDAVETVHLMAEVGHVPMLEAPEKFNQLLTQFLKP